MSPAQPRPRAAMAGDIVRVHIAELGGRGDGIGQHAGRAVFVPFALPGETVSVRHLTPRGEGYAGELVSIDRPSHQRRAAACRHFAHCGGCAVQHLSDDAYAEWKRSLVVRALEHRGLRDVPVAPLVRTPVGQRRRMVLSARCLRDGAVVGFHQRASRRLVDVIECPVAEPRIVALIAPLRRTLPALGEAIAATITVTDTDTGLDALIASEADLDLEARELLASFAAANDLARLSWAGGGLVVPIAQHRLPVLRLGALTVELPPGGFVQASRVAELAMQEHVAAWLQPAGSVVDLYAGIGTLTMPLLPQKRVHMVEGAASAVASVQRAARLPAARGKLTAECRDLARSPLAGEELARFDTVVFDPPRAGAAGQAAALAASSIATVVGVSCDPGTFARDARLLVDGGYVLEQVVPIDQFVWSHRVELVACFRRKRL